MNVSADPPSGFELATNNDGNPVILYRTRGAGLTAVFSAGWLTVWAVGCTWVTYEALLTPAGVDLGLTLLVLPFWAALVFVLGFCAWYFLSVTRFTLGPEMLVTERFLWRIRRRRQFPRSEVIAIRQVEHTGEEVDSRPSWGLAVVGRAPVRVLSHQPLAKVAWLGPVIARWAGVPFELATGPAETRYEEL
jgi:hypothetical protein